MPAYGRFLAEPGVDVAALFPLGILAHLPETDKRSYVDRFGLLERCVGGAVPFAGHDDRRVERLDGHALQLDPRPPRARGRPPQHRLLRPLRLRDGPLVTINAFSMGAWAAGFNMSLGMMRHGIVKSVGPDIDKILSTLAYLGPTYRYLIAGYPPFLKHLLDEGDATRLPVGATTSSTRSSAARA